MLLVFFLVTSSMDTDHGLGRQLAPMDDQRQEQHDVNRSNVLQISIDDNDQLTCDGQPVTLEQLGEQVESFLASRQTENYTIAVETGRHTSYNAYFEMQNTIVAAFHALREKMALQRYGHHFSQCTPEEREVIIKRYPLRISEAKPTQEGGSQ